MKKIVYTITFIISFILGILVDQKKQGEKILALSEKNDRNILYIKMYDLWIEQKQKNKSLASFFEKKGFRRIAVYGLNGLGKRMIDELQKTGIKVEYVIDKNADKICTDIEVFSPDSELKEADAIVVAQVYYFDEIEDLLQSKVKCPIISLEDVINNL